MEDDTVVVSPKRALVLAALLAAATSLCPARAEGLPGPRPLPLSPLPALGQRPLRGTLLAQAAPAPMEQDKIVAEPGVPPDAPAPPGAPPLGLGDRCRADGDCPQQALCMEGTCQRPKKGVSALFYFHKPGTSGHRVLVPFYFSFWGPAGRTRVLVPFFGESRDDGRKTRDLVVPLLLYQHHREPGTSAHRVWPFFFYSDYGDRGRAVGLLPLFYNSRRGADRLLVVPPLLTLYRGDDKGAFASVALLGWYRRTPEGASGGLFPLAWHFARRDGHTTAVLPFVFQGADQGRGLWHLTVMPLFHYRSDGGGRRRLLVTPLGGFYRDHEAQTVTSALLVPPLFHRDEPGRRLTVLPPFALWVRDRQRGRSYGYTGPLFWSIDGRGSTSGVAPLYFHFHDRRTQATTDLLLPIGALHRAPGRVAGAVGPLFFWWRKGSGGGGVFPILWAASGRTSYGLLLPLFAYVSDQDAGTRHLSFGPLYFRQRLRGPEAGWDAGALPLLVLGRRGSASYQALLPIFFHSRSPERERWVAGPFHVSRRFAQRPGDPEAGVTAGLFPLLWVKHTPRQSYGIVPPLLWVGRDGRRWTAALLPLLFYRSGEGEKLALGPGFYYRKAEGRTALVVGPYAHFSRPVEGGRERTHALLPLAFFHRGPRRSAAVLFPLFLQGSEDGTTVRSVGLLYWGVSRPGLSAHALFPLFLHARSERSTTTLLASAFLHRRHDGSAFAVGLLPLFGYVRDERRTVLFSPIGVYHHDRQKERTRGGLLLFYGDSQPSRADWGLVPLLFGWRRGTTTSVLAPLVFHSRDPAQQRSLTVLGPLYFGRSGAATFGGLAPLLFGRSGGDGSYRFTAVPLFHYDQGAGKAPTQRLFTALFGFIKNPAGFRAYLLTGYLRRDEEVRSEALLPIFYHSYNRLTLSRTLLFLPLLFRATTPATSLTAVTPLLWQYTSLTRRTLLALPLFLDDHHLYQKRLTAAGPLVPLFIRQRDHAAGSTTWIFPPLLTYVKRHTEGHDAAVFPLFWHFRSTERTTSVLLPLYAYLRRPDYRMALALPAFYYHLDETNRRRTVAFLPFFYQRSDPREATTIVFPLFWHTRSGAQRTLLTPLGGYQRTDRDHRLLVLNVYASWGHGPRAGSYSFHFWPLFSFGRPRRGDLEWFVLGGLLGYTRLGVERTLRLLWFIPIPLEPVGRRSAWYGATLRGGSTSTPF